MYFEISPKMQLNITVVFVVECWKYSLIKLPKQQVINYCLQYSFHSLFDFYENHYSILWKFSITSQSVLLNKGLFHLKICRFCFLIFPSLFYTKFSLYRYTIILKYWWYITDLIRPCLCVWPNSYVIHKYAISLAIIA